MSAAAVFACFSPVFAAGPVDVLRPSGAIPSRLVQDVENPRGFVETREGEALILDAATQRVYAVDKARAKARRIIEVGVEPGHIIRPTGFALGPNDILAIADAPGAASRVQYFDAGGRRINGFFLPVQPGVRLALGGLGLQGPGPLAFTGKTFVFNAPPSGSLMQEFDASGDAVRGIGLLRPTGHESDAALHLALNTGLPLVDPAGGFYFVFETGVPIFRKYDVAGRLVFERHVEGIEIDAATASLPTRWPSRAADEGRHPFTPGLVLTSAVDPSGRLWISLAAGYTYVYDRGGDKIRTIQFRAADTVIAPTSLFFARDRRLLVTPGCYEFVVD